MSATVTRYIVQRFVGGLSEGAEWVDVEPLTTPHRGPGVWEGRDAGDAFRQAVLENEDEKVRQASYRVLPWDGGVSFNVGITLDANVHGATEKEPANV